MVHLSYIKSAMDENNECLQPAKNHTRIHALCILIRTLANHDQIVQIHVYRLDVVVLPVCKF